MGNVIRLKPTRAMFGHEATQRVEVQVGLRRRPDEQAYVCDCGGQMFAIMLRPGQHKADLRCVTCGATMPLRGVAE